MDKNGVRVMFIGDRAAFPEVLQQKMQEGEAQTQHNNALTLSDSGKLRRTLGHYPGYPKIVDKMESGEISKQSVSPELIEKHLSTAGLPDPDLFIRTGGEERVSNFLLWQLAYTELYFTPTLWPDFDQGSLDDAISSFKTRERRFGHTGEQILNKTASL